MQAALPGTRIAVPPPQPRALACHDPAARIAALSGESMGTSWHVRIALPQGHDLAAIRAAIAARLDLIVAQMSHWVPDSLLSRFNAAPGGSWLALPDDFATVIAAGLDIAERSNAAFDPAIGRLTDLHGLGPRAIAAPPAPAALDEALHRSGWQRLAYEPETRRLRQPGGLWLDLSGIAKGHAVDAVADLLAARGIGHCLVEIGGECAGRGIRPDGDPWWVELECPPGTGMPPLRVALHEIAVATSGNYVRGDHSLDPRSGRPSRNDIVSVSVLHARAMIADAWATALTIAGPAEGARLAEREGLAARIVTRTGDTAREWMSPALVAMLDD